MGIIKFSKRKISSKYPKIKTFQKLADIWDSTEDIILISDGMLSLCNYVYYYWSGLWCIVQVLLLVFCFCQEFIIFEYEI